MKTKWYHSKSGSIESWLTDRDNDAFISLTPGHLWYEVSWSTGNDWHYERYDTKIGAMARVRELKATL